MKWSRFRYLDYSFRSLVFHPEVHRVSLHFSKIYIFPRSKSIHFCEFSKFNLIYFIISLFYIPCVQEIAFVLNSSFDGRTVRIRGIPGIGKRFEMANSGFVYTSTISIPIYVVAKLFRIKSKLFDWNPLFLVIKSTAGIRYGLVTVSKATGLVFFYVSQVYSTMFFFIEKFSNHSIFFDRS